MTGNAIVVQGAAIRTLEEEGYDFVGAGFSRIWDGAGKVVEWVRPPNPDIDLARQHDEHYRRLFQ